jgi:hypothetical protein
MNEREKMRATEWERKGEREREARCTDIKGLVHIKIGYGIRGLFI